MNNIILGLKLPNDCICRFKVFCCTVPQCSLTLGRLYCVRIYSPSVAGNSLNQLDATKTIVFMFIG